MSFYVDFTYLTWNIPFINIGRCCSDGDLCNILKLHWAEMKRAWNQRVSGGCLAAGLSHADGVACLVSVRDALLKSVKLSEAPLTHWDSRRADNPGSLFLKPVSQFEGASLVERLFGPWCRMYSLRGRVCGLMPKWEENSHFCKSLLVVSDSDIPPVILQAVQTSDSVCVLVLSDHGLWPVLFQPVSVTPDVFSLTLPYCINVDGSGPGTTHTHTHTQGRINVKVSDPI